MNPALYICVFLPIIIAIIIQSNTKKAIIASIVRKHKNRNEEPIMNEIVKEFIGKDCYIYTLQSNVSGIIKKVEDSWIVIETRNGDEIVKLEYIIRIMPCPLNKKGKKKFGY